MSYCLTSHEYTGPRLHRHRIYGLSGNIVNFWLVPNGMGFHTMKYVGYLVKIGQNFGYMVNFRGYKGHEMEAPVLHRLLGDLPEAGALHGRVVVPVG